MGILGTVAKVGTGGNDDGKNKRTYQGDHNLSLDDALNPTDDNVINPLNQNVWDSIRTQGVVTTPQYFSQAQADQLKTLAKTKKAEAIATQKAYKALGSLEKSDTTVHTSHRKYQKSVADCELIKQRSNASLARKLHRQRPQYTQLGVGIQKAESKANTRVTELRTKFESLT